MKTLLFILLITVITACNSEPTFKPTCDEVNNKVIELTEIGKINEALQIVLHYDCPEAMVTYMGKLDSLAILYRLSENYDSSVAYYKQALRVIDAGLGKDNEIWLQLIIGLGDSYNKMGNPRQALASYTLADMVYLSKHQDDSNYIKVLDKIAQVYEEFRDNQQALYYYKRIEKFKKNRFGGKSMDYVSSLIEVARINVKLQNFDSAFSQANHALLIVKDTINDRTKIPLYADCLSILSIVYSEKKEIDKALEMYKKATEITKAFFGEDHPEYMAMLRDLAALYERNGNHEKALHLLEETKNYLLKHNTSEVISGILGKCISDMAGISYEMGNVEKAMNYIDTANSILKNEITKSIIFLTNDQKELFIERFKKNFEIECSIIYKSGSQALNSSVYDNLLFLKDLLLNDERKSLDALLSSKDPSIKKLLHIKDSLQNYFNYQYSLPKDKRDSNIVRKLKIFGDIEAELTTKVSELRRNDLQTAIHGSDIYSKLSKSDAAIEFFHFNYFGKKGWTDSTLYAALVITPESQTPKLIYLFEEKQLRKLFADSADNKDQINRLYNDFTLKESDPNGTLYKLIWAKPEKYLNGIHRIFYSPSGSLNSIAFAAIPTLESNRTLCDEYELVSVESTRSILSQPNINYKIKDAYLYAPKTFDPDSITYKLASNWKSSWKPLRNSENEVNYLKDLLEAKKIETTVLTGPGATEESIKQLSGHSPDILHIDTHGFYYSNEEKAQAGQKNDRSFHEKHFYEVAEDPMFRSGLIMFGANLKWVYDINIPGKEDGVLTAQEISQLNFGGTKLVVLSACKSGLGYEKNIEGVFGLQRGFKLAGVQSIIYSLWDIPSNETVEFMDMFYKKWIAERKSIRTALYETQNSQKNKYIKEPYKWAAFVLIE